MLHLEIPCRSVDCGLDFLSERQLIRLVNLKYRRIQAEVRSRRLRQRNQGACSWPSQIMLDDLLWFICAFAMSSSALEETVLIPDMGRRYLFWYR